MEITDGLVTHETQYSADPFAAAPGAPRWPSRFRPATRRDELHIGAHGPVGRLRLPTSDLHPPRGRSSGAQDGRRVVMNTTTNAIDAARLERFVGQAVTDMGAAMNGVLVMIGGELGLWKAMAGGAL